jgi:hypothetical protein
MAVAARRKPNNIRFLHRDRGYRWADQDVDMVRVCTLMDQSGPNERGHHQGRVREYKPRGSHPLQDPGKLADRQDETPAAHAPESGSRRARV